MFVKGDLLTELNVNVASSVVFLFARQQQYY